MSKNFVFFLAVTEIRHLEVWKDTAVVATIKPVFAERRALGNAFATQNVDNSEVSDVEKLGD